MQYTIQIPKPCHESWDAMTPEQDGRHCAQCCKTVVDFTNWLQEDILDYMQQGKGNVCGRFRPEQLNVPISETAFITSIIRAQLPYLKKIAAIFLFAFGMLHMDPEASAQTAAKQAPEVQTRTLGAPVVEHEVMGKIAQPRPAKHDTTRRAKTHKVKHVKPASPDHHIMGGAIPAPYPEHLQGDVMIEPVPLKNDTAKKRP